MTYASWSIDSDPQGNATSGLGVSKDPDKPSLYHVMLGDTHLKDAIRPTGFEGLDIITADKNLIGSNLELIDLERREYRLATARPKSATTITSF